MSPDTKFHFDSATTYERNPSRVLILDKQPIVITGLSELLKDEKDFEICAAGTSIAEAGRLLRFESPDVLVSDIVFSDGNVFSFLESINERQDLKIVIFTFQTDRAYLQRAMHLNVSGFVLKSSDSAAIVHALHSLRQGGVYVDPALIGRAISGRHTRFEAFEDALSDAAQRLSNRELETLRLVAFGYSIKEIARKLDVSPKSVETYKARASMKLGLASRASIVRYAMASGWFETENGVAGG